MSHKVFCNELERLVSGEEVWEMKYGKHRINQDLTFKCADTDCQAVFILQNCVAHFQPWETRFRLYPRSKHRADCTFADYKRNQHNARIRALPKQDFRAIRLYK